MCVCECECVCVCVCVCVHVCIRGSLKQAHKRAHMRIHTARTHPASHLYYTHAHDTPHTRTHAPRMLDSFCHGRVHAIPIRTISCVTTHHLRLQVWTQMCVFVRAPRACLSWACVVLCVAEFHPPTHPPEVVPVAPPVHPPVAPEAARSTRWPVRWQLTRNTVVRPPSQPRVPVCRGGGGAGAQKEEGGVGERG